MSCESIITYSPPLLIWRWGKENIFFAITTTEYLSKPTAEKVGILSRNGIHQLFLDAHWSEHICFLLRAIKYVPVKFELLVHGKEKGDFQALDTKRRDSISFIESSTVRLRSAISRLTSVQRFKRCTWTELALYQLLPPVGFGWVLIIGLLFWRPSRQHPLTK